MIKKTISSLVLCGLCCTPLVAVGQHDDHPDNHDQQYSRQDNHDQQYSRQDSHDQYSRQDRRDQQYGRHDDRDHYVRHNEWRRGYHMRHDDWDRGQRVDDWRAHHLRQPPRGYEWREVDGNYILAAAATGVIASVIAASAAH